MQPAVPWTASSARLITPVALEQQLGDWRDGGPAYRELAQRLVQLVLDGRLGTSVRLPAERVLAERLLLSRNTVSGAFALLREQGFLESHRGSGSVTRLPEQVVGRVLPWMPGVVSLGEPATLDLRVASLAAPSQLGELYRVTAERFAADLADTGYLLYGLPELRVAIAERYCRRGLPTTADQILVTSGAQQAIDLIVRHLVRARETVLVESPTYAGALDALRVAGARTVGVDVDDRGWDCGEFIDVARGTGARVAYLIPDFQNPTGQLMDDGRRAELVRALVRQDVTVIADETLAELALAPAKPPVQPLAAHDRSATVISVGSLSKAVWAGLRIGWLRASPALVTTLATTVRTAADLGTAPFEQRVATAVFEQLDELLVERLERLSERRDHLVRELDRTLGWSVTPPRGGLSAWVQLPEARSTLLAQVAPRFGVLLVAGPRLSPDGTLDRFLRLPFALSPELLDLAIQRLGDAWALARNTRLRNPIPLV